MNYFLFLYSMLITIVCISLFVCLFFSLYFLIPSFSLEHIFFLSTLRIFTINCLYYLVICKKIFMYLLNNLKILFWCFKNWLQVKTFMIKLLKHVKNNIIWCLLNSYVVYLISIFYWLKFSFKSKYKVSIFWLCF